MSLGRSGEYDFSGVVNCAGREKSQLIGGTVEFVHSEKFSFGPTASSASMNLCDCPLAVKLAEQGYSNLMQRSHRWPGHERSNGVH